MKISKLFLTGMAALLSFGLMMTGCDSGGDSDSDSGGNTVSFAADVTSGTALKAAVSSGLDAAGAVTYAVAKGDKKLTITLTGGGLLVEATGDASGIVKVGADAATAGNLKGWVPTYTDAAADATTLVVNFDGANATGSISNVSIDADKLKLLVGGTPDANTRATALAGAISSESTGATAAGAVVTLTNDWALGENRRIPAGVTVNTGAKDIVATIHNLAVEGNINLATATHLVSSTTGTITIGRGGNTVSATNATFTAVAVEATFAAGATGTVTLSDTNTITFADGGSITIAGTGTVELVNTTLGAGTYTADGATVISSLAAGDTIVTAGTADKGLIIGTGTSNYVKLYALDGNAATATFVATTDDTPVKVTFSDAGITLPAATASNKVGATMGITASSTFAGIELKGTSGIVFGGGGNDQPAVLTLVTGSKIKKFGTSGVTAATIAGADGTVAVDGGSSGTLVGATGVFTATTADVTLTGPASGTATINESSTPAAAG